MLKKGLVVGLFLMFGMSFRLISGENAASKEDDVLDLVKRVAWHTDPDPSHFIIFKKIYTADSRLVLDILPLLDVKKPAFYNANLIGMIQVLERKNVCSTALPKIRDLLDATSEDASMIMLHCGVFEYLSEFGDASDCVRLEKFKLSEDIAIRTISAREQKKLETRLAAMKTNTIPVSVPVQSVTNVTANSSKPTNLDRVSNVVPSTTIEKTNGQSAGFKWTIIVTFLIVAVSGVLLIFFRRWKKR